MGDAPAQITYGDDCDELGWDVDPTKDDLEYVDVDSKFFYPHSQTVVGKTSRKPDRQIGIGQHLQTN